MDALALQHGQQVQVAEADGTLQEQLRKQMQADALSVLSEEEEETDITTKDKKTLVDLNQQYDPGFLEEVIQFLRLQV